MPDLFQDTTCVNFPQATRLAPSRRTWSERRLAEYRGCVGYRRLRPTFEPTVALVGLNCGAISMSGSPVPGAIDFPPTTQNMPSSFESIRLDDPVVLGFHPSGWHKSYFHFMFDVLPRIQLALERQTELEVKPTIIVDASAREPHYRRFMELLQAQSSQVRVVEINENSLLFPRSVFTVSGLRDYRGTDRKRWDRIHPQSLGLVNRFFEPHGPTKSEASYNANRRIYISRDLAASRKTINETRIWSVLKEFGFERIYLENISIRAQIDLFREVDLVVAVHGAGLSNLAFADRPKVFEIFSPGHRVRPEYFQLTTLVGGSYFYSVGTDDAAQNGVQVPERAVYRFLRAVGDL